MKPASAMAGPSKAPIRAAVKRGNGQRQRLVPSQFGLGESATGPTEAHDRDMC